MNNETIHDRISLLVETFGEGKNTVFASLVGVNEANLRGYRNSVMPKSDFLEKIARTFDINLRWLLTGDGDMSNSSCGQVTKTPSTNKDIKILDIRVCAGQGIGFEGEENKVIGYVNIPEFSGCYGITVFGDSMYDMYIPGDTIFVRPIRDIHSIENGQPYVIITKEDRLLKLIHIDYANKRTILSSYNNSINPDGRRKYPDMEIELDNDVVFLYKVVGKLSRSQM